MPDPVAPPTQGRAARIMLAPVARSMRDQTGHVTPAPEERATLAPAEPATPTATKPSNVQQSVNNDASIDETILPRRQPGNRRRSGSTEDGTLTVTNGSKTLVQQQGV